MSYVIREATDADFESLLAMWTTLAYELPKDHFQPFGIPDKNLCGELLATVLSDTINAEQARIYVAEDPQAIATIAVVLNEQKGYTQPNSAVIYNLWVDEDRRREGIATALMQTAEEWLATQKVTSVQVGHHPNSKAHAFWQHHGYEPYELITAKFL